MKVNDTIGGKYRVRRLLGSGGTAEVYLAWDLRLQKYWAVKQIRKTAVKQKMLDSEAELLGRLDHPALPRIVDRVEDREYVYLIMDFIEGESLEQVLKREGPQGGSRIWEWAGELGQVLDYLHTRRPPVLYRDLKPANVLIQKEGGLKLVDLGIASAEGEAAEGWGTRGYASPEQFKGEQDCRSDIYCLGVTLYRMATGKLPVRKRGKKIAGLSGNLSAILWKCMEYQKEKRFRSCREFLTALEKCPENGIRHGRQLSKRRKWLLTAATALLLCCSVAANELLERREREVTYGQWIEKAEKTVKQEERKEAVRQAVLLCPEKTEGYLLLLECFKEDESFSPAEEKELLALLERGGGRLKEQPEYPDLTFQIGKLYWYYYSYGRADISQEGSASDNELTRMKAAIPWFEETGRKGEETEQGAMAGVYREVGVFYRDLAARVREGAEAGQYLVFWRNLNALAEEVNGGADLPETARLEFWRMCIRAVSSYENEFAAEGVADREVREFLEMSVKAAETMDPSTGRGRALQEEIKHEGKILGKEAFYDG